MNTRFYTLIYVDYGGGGMTPVVAVGGRYGSVTPVIAASGGNDDSRTNVRNRVQCLSSGAAAAGEVFDAGYVKNSVSDK